MSDLSSGSIKIAADRYEGSDLSRSQKKMLELAIRVAEGSTYVDGSKRHGAVITRGGSVISVGMNKMRNINGVPPTLKYDPNVSVHAEIDALSRVADARGAVIYIARISKSGTANSRPCNACSEALRAAGVKRVIYTV